VVCSSTLQHSNNYKPKWDGRDPEIKEEKKDLDICMQVTGGKRLVGLFPRSLEESPFWKLEHGQDRMEAMATCTLHIYAGVHVHVPSKCPKNVIGLLSISEYYNQARVWSARGEK
jgi:hypothetical protein